MPHETRRASASDHLRRAVTRSRSRSKPVKQDRAVFAEAGPAPRIPVSRALYWAERTIYKSGAKRTAGPPKGRPAKRSAAGPLETQAAPQRPGACLRATGIQIGALEGYLDW
ncbi:hypothetical protein ON010_g1726 [Phytophthora cinnamomi]|nr:hypothetical protein ON010_g1726 [Phytophthora cinnamomi]